MSNFKMHVPCGKQTEWNHRAYSVLSVTDLTYAGSQLPGCPDLHSGTNIPVLCPALRLKCFIFIIFRRALVTLQLTTRQVPKQIQQKRLQDTLNPQDLSIMRVQQGIYTELTAREGIEIKYIEYNAGSSHSIRPPYYITKLPCELIAAISCGN